jgi:hypothetical protein
MYKRPFTRRQFFAGFSALGFGSCLESIVANDLQSLQGKVKITSVEIIPVTAMDDRPSVFVEVGTSAGITGAGEAISSTW